MQQVEALHFMSAAADMLGIRSATIRSWLHHGRRDLAEGRESLFATFATRLTRARAVAELGALANLKQAAQGGEVLETTTRERLDRKGKVVERVTTTRRQPKDWRASAWILERVNRKRWGRRDQVAVANPDGTLVLGDRWIEFGKARPRPEKPQTERGETLH